MRHLRACVTLVGLLLAVTTAPAQETLIVFQAGSSRLTNTIGTQSSGYRLNLAVELMPENETITLGVAVGTQNLSGEQAGTPFDLSTVSFCVVSRYMFGWEKLKGYVRVGLGAQSSTLELEYTPYTSKETRFGMMSDISGGVMYWAGKKFFVAGDISWLWLTGSFQNMSTIGVVSMSAGFKI